MMDKEMKEAMEFMFSKGDEIKIICKAEDHEGNEMCFEFITDELTMGDGNIKFDSKDVKVTVDKLEFKYPKAYKEK